MEIEIVQMYLQPLTVKDKLFYNLYEYIFNRTVEMNNFLRPIFHLKNKGLSITLDM